MNRLQKIGVFGFYGGFSLLLLLIVTDTLRQVIPEEIAVRLGYNSEAYLFALALAAWIQFVRPRLQVRSAHVRWSWTVGFAAVWAAIGFNLFMSDLPSRIKTLDESSFALAILIPYVMFRRPLHSRVFLAIPVLIGVTVWGISLEPDGWTPEPEGWIVDQAEAFGFVMLAIIAFDAIDRGILNPSARTNPVVRWIWYAFLALEVMIVSALGTVARQGEGVVPTTLEWLGRIHESFIGILAVSLLFAVVLGRTGRRDATRSQQGTSLTGAGRDAEPHGSQ